MRRLTLLTQLSGALANFRPFTDLRLTLSSCPPEDFPQKIRGSGFKPSDDQAAF